ncbi:MAG: alanyl-tRNA editing protein [Gemmatimonadales bacterium]
MAVLDTLRRYYSDSYTTRFTAGVVEATEHGGHPAVILDQTYFYPTSGGQPHDTGTLNGVRVIDVVVREDGAVVHLLAESITPGPVTGEIDQQRRRDHMQQHTAQHILSQAFIQIANAPTIGFHLGQDYVSIDLDTAQLDDTQRSAAFALARRTIEQATPVRAWFPDDAELATIALRKTPDVEGPLRIVAIGDFDVSACGGTHVANTAEIGLIHWLRTERLKRGFRVAFHAGDRAQRDYEFKQQITSGLGAALSCSLTELPDAVARLQNDLQAARREVARFRDEGLDREAAALAKDAVAGPAGTKVVVAAWSGRPVEELRALALKATAGPGIVAFFASASGEKTQLAFGRSEDVAVDLKPSLDAALAVLGGGKGGGSRLIQAGAAAAPIETVRQALDAAVRRLDGIG